MAFRAATASEGMLKGDRFVREFDTLNIAFKRPKNDDLLRNLRILNQQHLHCILSSSYQRLFFLFSYLLSSICGFFSTGRDKREWNAVWIKVCAFFLAPLFLVIVRTKVVFLSRFEEEIVRHVLGATGTKTALQSLEYYSAKNL